MGIFFRTESSPKVVQVQPKAWPPAEKLHIKHKNEAVKYARELRDHVDRLAPTIDFFDEVAGQNARALVESLDRCIELIENDNTEPSLLSFRFPKQFSVVLKSILAVGETKRPLFESIVKIPAFLEYEKRKRIEERIQRDAEAKRLALEAAAKAEQERIASERKFYLEKLGLNESDIKRLKGEQ